jgi:hypothetical protein
MKQLTILAIVVGCLLTGSLFAQDTVYIYEEVIVYDTVYEYIEKRVNPFEDTKAMHIIQVDTLTQTSNLLIIGNGKTTSIPIDNLILSDDVKKRDSTSNMGFWNLMTFAAKNMLIDKSTLDMYMGFGAWTSLCNKIIVEDHLAWNPGGNGTLNFGVNYETQFISHFTIGTGAGIHFLFENEGLKGKFTCNYPDCNSCSSNEKYTINIGTFNIEKGEKGHGEGLDMHWDENESTGQYEDSVGLVESTTNYVMFAVPARLGYRIGNFTPYLGAEYNIRMAMNNDLKDLHSLGIITGMRYDINRHFAVSTNFYTAITKDMSHTGTLYSRSDGARIRTDKYNWRTFRLEFAGHFKF